MPHADRIKQLRLAFEREIRPYQLPGNLIAQNLYDDLELPWTADPNQTAFPRDEYRRVEWDRDGVLSDGKDFLGGSLAYTLEQYERGLGTASAVTRWREARPELVGTERDCVKLHVGRMRELLGDTKLRGGSETVLLLFKKAG